MKNKLPLMDFTEITLRLKTSSRGGGIEIALDTLGYPGGKMTAYQNYLGGGMLGAVQSDCNISRWQHDAALCDIAEKLKQYFHALTNPDSEWESTSYEQNQNMPSAAY